ncbi:MAG TPA: HesA/MoeB/ThiF family protein [Geobacteraceae bacterium]|nr:HesA/MoeB/ThiF family protein [Geobacteraceae bacterium]
MEPIEDFLRGRACDDLLPWTSQNAAMTEFNLPCWVVEELALVLGLLPARYQRNRQTISTRQQLTLFRSRVVVVGCGGLGGYILEELARLGAGTIIAVDPDVFEEHNLNRQLLATPSSLGLPKVVAAAARIAEVNPAVTVVPYRLAYEPANGHELLRGARVVVDALDSISTRLDLADSCADLEIPLVHGAIGGWYGQVTTQFPGDDTLQQIYRHWASGKGVEQQLGNPSFTPAVVASLQVAEVCKVLLGMGEPLRRRKLVVNLLDMEFEEVLFEHHLAVVGE